MPFGKETNWTYSSQFLHREREHGPSDWIGLSSVLRPRQHSIGYMGDGFYRSKDPTNSIKAWPFGLLLHLW